MARIPKSKWVEARVRWETSPDVTFADIARQLGVHPATVHERARREGWVKVVSYVARPAGVPAPESLEAYRESATEVAQLHAKLLVRARADLELFRSKLMRAIEAADDADVVRYATAFGVYLDRLYVHILREREVWGLTESGAPEVRIVRRGWIVVGGSNGNSNGSSNGSSD